MKFIAITILIFLALLSVLLLWTSNRRQVLIAFDQMINARLGGYADETLSARCWRSRNTKRRYALLVRVIDTLFFWQDDHCRKAYESEVKRSHLPVYYRDSGI